MRILYKSFLICYFGGLGVAPAATVFTDTFGQTSPTPDQGSIVGFTSATDSGVVGESIGFFTAGLANTLNGFNSGLDNLNSGWETRISATVDPGEILTNQVISFDGSTTFDDGWMLSLDGTTLLDFDFSNYNSNADFLSAFNGNWSPWLNDGNPLLTISQSGGVQLLATASSNPTLGSQLEMDGITTGTRFNVLDYFTSDVYVSGPLTFDFLNGVDIGIYNRNEGGPWQLNSLGITVSADVVTPEPSTLLFSALGCFTCFFRRQR